MLTWRINTRQVLAIVALLASMGLLIFSRTDHVPHDASARVKPEVFWAAMARPNPAQHPTNIVVYPLNMGVQLVTCTGHPPNGPSLGKYFYEMIAPGDPTVEERLVKLGVPFETPWWDNNWMRYGPWVFAGLAFILLMLPAMTGFGRIVAEAKSNAPVASPNPPPQATGADLEKVRELDAAMETSLSASASPDSPQVAADTTAAAPTTVRTLNGGPLKPIEPVAEEGKDYRGEFYPVEKPHKREGFTLVELIVVIGVIAVLFALLLPTLAGSRRDANQIACAANLLNIGQALVEYEDDNNGAIPASYSYHGQTVVNGKQTQTNQGYVHWSYFLYSRGSISTEAFTCPELDGGGLPPTNTTDSNLLPGQVNDTPGVVDDQATRVAYTLNEALSPRNKFALGFQGALRVYQFIHVSSIPHSSTTILASEWGPKAARFLASNGQFTVDSHRPVHGFVGLDGTLDMFELQPGLGYRRVTAADLDPDPNSASSSTTRLDWVGRNHGNMQGYPDERRSNFLYLDGHVECKSIYDTLMPFQWGDKFYTLVPNDDLK
jgi:prepilin-type N-terminal cleavage/methylation domain-containing protein/prepilin-type processing-associated H-X9-DG protein